MDLNFLWKKLSRNPSVNFGTIAIYFPDEIVQKLGKFLCWLFWLCPCIEGFWERSCLARREIMEKVVVLLERLINMEGYVLHHAAARCNMLQHCNAMQRTATHCNALQRTATHCNALQPIATHCNTLQNMMNFSSLGLESFWCSGSLWGDNNEHAL